jgi:tetratricopeptide (TPR) repeat protein
MQTTRLTKLLEFLEADPNDPFVLYAIATEYNTSNEQDKAFEYYNKLINEHPTYVGTYYHLGKLHEKNQQTEAAIDIYKRGMQAARNKSDNHAFSELQGAYSSAMGLDYEDD